VSVVPRDPISRRCVAKNLTHGPGTGGVLGRFRLCDDAISHLENHRSSFLVHSRSYRRDALWSGSPLDVIVGPGQSQAQVLDWTAMTPVRLPMLALGP
jgi:hypothetical protein